MYLLFFLFEQQESLENIVAAKESSDDLEECSNEEKEVEKVNGKAKKNIKEKEKEKEKENGKEKEKMTSPPKLIGDKNESPNNKEENETKIVKKEEIDDEEEEEEEEDVMREQEVSLKLNRSLAWFQAPLPPEKSSYTPVHILSSSSTSSSTSSGEHSSAVKDSLDHSIDCVRNEVLEVLTKTIYSVARSLRSDPVSEILSLPTGCFSSLPHVVVQDRS